MAQTAEELWAAAARSALGAEEEEVALEVDEEMAVEEDLGGAAGALEGMTAEEEAEAALLVQAELAALEGEGEVELETAVTGEADVDVTVEAEAAAEDTVEIEVEAEETAVEAPVPAAAAATPPWREAEGKARGKGTGAWRGPGKGLDKGKGSDKGKSLDKGKGRGKGGGKGKSETFFGLVHQVGEKTGNMLVKSWKVSERYGQEAMIPKKANPSGAVLGDKISFEVLERPDGARPLAVNVQVRGHVDLSPEAIGPPEELRRQVLYYLSDDNLRTDKFFQDIIAKSEGGWIDMSVVLGCPRMKQMRATCKGVFAAVRGCPEVELREAPAGSEAIRRTRPPPLLEKTAAREWGSRGPAKGKAKGGSGGSGEPAAGGADATANDDGGGAAEEGADLYYAGVVKSQMRMEPRKLFISCDEITQAYGRDAYFLPDEKPTGVEVGSLVVFAVSASSEVGFSPHASFVGRLAPLGSLGRQEEKSNNGSGAVSRGPGVQRTIVKKGGGR